MTQGPLDDTVDDFWQMCWRTRAGLVVMLANCVESGRVFMVYWK